MRQSGQFWEEHHRDARQLCGKGERAHDADDKELYPQTRTFFFQRTHKACSWIGGNRLLSPGHLHVFLNCAAERPNDSWRSGLIEFTAHEAR